MSLNERKTKILKAIINDYIITAEPVGSRTIAKKYNLGISSATIRNEMSDLEDMGYIIQPHASAGRIPSDLGYRFYVDQLMHREELTDEEQHFLQGIVIKNVNQIDYLMEETAKALSMLTNYTTITSEPVVKKTRLKQIRLMPLDSSSIMLVVVTDQNYTKNHIIKVKAEPVEDDLYKASSKINRILQGHTLEEIDETVLTQLYSELSENSVIIQPMLKAIEKTVAAAQSMHIHLSGTSNILSFPEFSNVQKANTLFQTLEEKDILVTLLGDTIGNDIQILIGNENTIQEMKDCSIITSTYNVGNNIHGSIGIIGPTRMNYSQVVSVLSSMAKNIEKVLMALTEGKNDS